jgi:hypothetical protein
MWGWDLRTTKFDFFMTDCGAEQRAFRGTAMMKRDIIANSAENNFLSFQCFMLDSPLPSVGQLTRA